MLCLWARDQYAQFLSTSWSKDNRLEGEFLNKLWAFINPPFTVITNKQLIINSASWGLRSSECTISPYMEYSPLLSSTFQVLCHSRISSKTKASDIWIHVVLLKTQCKTNLEHKGTKSCMFAKTKWPILLAHFHVNYTCKLHTCARFLLRFDGCSPSINVRYIFQFSWNFAFKTV